jgi:hypothetical protein
VLGKTFEALAIIKYYELRNDRVLVLVPKRLRDNWTMYKANDQRNFLAGDRFHYDVLNHTDLSRDAGKSGDIDLAHINWGNYDLVVIDESHNFRNKATHREHETRYDLLMRRIIKEGVKTRVLMLTATPVNNRLADLKNQIAFVTEGVDTALLKHGISSVEATVRQAQLQFNKWMAMEEADRKPARLLDMLGFDYFKLLDLLTIARSRKHIEKYYGTAETGRFPDRLKPINFKPDVDRIGSPNAHIQLVNFWPNLELEKYINLEQRVSGRMVLLDISATGEENLIEQQSGNQMNDLEYRRRQLLKLQDAVIDLEDLGNGISIADLTFTDFRVDLAGYLKDHEEQLQRTALGSFAVTTTPESGIPPGILFCLRAAGAGTTSDFAWT